MQLIHAPTSPFARKVRVLASEVGLLPRIELIDTSVLPVTLNERVNAFNPLGKVPVLLTDEGEALFDSRVICEYLDSLHDRRPLFPAQQAERWRTLRVAAVADGLMDAALLLRYEQAVRPAELQWDQWIAGQLGKVTRALQLLEAHAEHLKGPVDIAQISVACALGYLDFRFPHLQWRDNARTLADFDAHFSSRPSMTSTRPS